MKFYKYLYVTEKYRNKKKKICWKLKWNIGQVRVHVIALSTGNDILEIYHCSYLKQKAINKENVFVVGLAEGYSEAIELSRFIVDDIYVKTGDVNVKEFILDQHTKKRVL